MTPDSSTSMRSIVLGDGGCHVDQCTGVGGLPTYLVGSEIFAHWIGEIRGKFAPRSQRGVSSVSIGRATRMRIAFIARNDDSLLLGGTRAGVPPAGMILQKGIWAAPIIDGLTDR